MRADVSTSTIEVQRIGWDTVMEKIDTQVESGHAGGDEVMAKSLVETLLHGAAPLAGVEDGMKSAIAAFGIDQATDTGCVIDLHALWSRAGINSRSGS